MSDRKLRAVPSKVRCWTTRRCRFKERHSLVVIDCEGAEFELLDPERDPSLVAADIIVEIHEDHGDPLELAQRFTSTHTINRARRAARLASDMPIDIPGVDPRAAMDEWRSEQSWLYLRTMHMKGKPGML